MLNCNFSSTGKQRSNVFGAQFVRPKNPSEREREWRHREKRKYSQLLCEFLLIVLHEPLLIHQSTTDSEIVVSAVSCFSSCKCSISFAPHVFDDMSLRVLFVSYSCFSAMSLPDVHIDSFMSSSVSAESTRIIVSGLTKKSLSFGDDVHFQIITTWTFDGQKSI